MSVTLLEKEEPVESKDKIDWHSTKEVNPNFKCRKCGSNDILYREVESFDGAYDDYNYVCQNCGHDWWVESSDY